MTVELLLVFGVLIATLATVKVIYSKIKAANEANFERSNTLIDERVASISTSSEKCVSGRIVSFTIPGSDVVKIDKYGYPIPCYSHLQ